MVEEFYEKIKNFYTLINNYLFIELIELINFLKDNLIEEKENLKKHFILKNLVILEQIKNKFKNITNSLIYLISKENKKINQSLKNSFKINFQLSENFELFDLFFNELNYLLKKYGINEVDCNRIEKIKNTIIFLYNKERKE